MHSRGQQSIDNGKSPGLSVKRVTLGKSLTISETLCPTLEIRANSPSLGSKEIKRALTLYEQKQVL